ncbi:DUF4230 domain-containing protein [Clostridium grantii]|uniref:DUF4230 domain-containing protein n=1 Tax=Clostridium grantii DSM 8605 TaxID=1121316 RepID=A0A1M5VNS6_9CLOT|nr:DUF4230 domain-containing protein [Clostridium grantii]SHH76818.1 Protein of unknown function [Clostridium grantii DSM 8605]
MFQAGLAKTTKFSVRTFLSKLIIKILVYLIIIGIIFVLVISVFDNFEIKEKNTLTAGLIEEKIANISELATLKYTYKNVVTLKTSKEFSDNFKIPFTDKSLIFTYNGYIKAGIDLTSVDVSINKDDESVIIKVKHAAILDNIVDEESVEVFDEKSSVFNKIKTSDYLDSIVAEKEKTEKELIKNGFLEQANDHTKLILDTLVSEMGFKKIEIKFED